MTDNGVSQLTFMKLIKQADTTLIVCVDDQGHKFGAVCFEEWVHRKNFYGTGESFVFTFHQGDDCKAYTGTGNN
jgi:hypothetical protein